MALLFTPLTLRGLTLPNRIAVAPMCQYQAVDGRPTAWHGVHYGGLAQGGAGLILTEAVAVAPEGRISPGDLGLWEDAQVPGLAALTGFMAAQGVVPGIQLAHAGRKACTAPPWQGTGGVPVAEGGWVPVAPSPLPFDARSTPPTELDRDGIAAVVAAFAAAARRALAAGFRVAEVHGAHGYLIHEFLSPLTNRRTDGYGGTFEGRTRLAREVAAAVRAAWPADLPVFMRLSCTDWVAGGWDLPQTVALARQLKALGVDLIDCSSGGLVPDAVVPAAPGYQVPFAAAVRAEAALPTGAVGLITAPDQAEAVLAEGRADLVLLGRELLRDPRWPLRAAQELGVEASWPPSYIRAARGPARLRQPLG